MAIRLRYTELAPEGYAKLVGVGHYINTGTALGPVLLGLVYLRASQMNECDFWHRSAYGGTAASP